MAYFLMSVMLFSFLTCFASSEANNEKDEPHIIKKSSLCPAIAEESYCTNNFNFVKTIEQLTKDTELSGKHMDVTKDSARCADAMRKEMCSSAKPLCLEDADGEDSGARQVCKNLGQSCSFLSDEDDCVSYVKGQFTDLTCKSVGDDKFKGICPKPEKKMPSAYIQLYQLQSTVLEAPLEAMKRINKMAGNKLFSADCLKTMEDLMCVPINCTEDGNSVTLPNMETKCNKMMECVAKLADNSKELSSISKPATDLITRSCEMVVKALKSEKTNGSSCNSLSPQFVLVFVSLCFKFFWW